MSSTYSTALCPSLKGSITEGPHGLLFLPTLFSKTIHSHFIGEELGERKTLQGKTSSCQSVGRRKTSNDPLGHHISAQEVTAALPQLILHILVGCPPPGWKTLAVSSTCGVTNALQLGEAKRRQISLCLLESTYLCTDLCSSCSSLLCHTMKRRSEFHRIGAKGEHSGQECWHSL